ncbi:MAG: hypothetical protein AAB214_18855, partial [Fibrobacterota bacterium]
MADDFAFLGAQAIHHGTDAFAAQLSSSGLLLWTTFMGGAYTDYGTAIAVDTSSNPNVIWVALDWQRVWNFN